MAFPDLIDKKEAFNQLRIVRESLFPKNQGELLKLSNAFKLDGLDIDEDTKKIELRNNRLSRRALKLHSKVSIAGASFVHRVDLLVDLDPRSKRSKKVDFPKPYIKDMFVYSASKSLGG